MLLGLELSRWLTKAILLGLELSRRSSGNYVVDDCNICTQQQIEHAQVSENGAVIKLVIFVAMYLSILQVGYHVRMYVHISAVHNQFGTVYIFACEKYPCM